MPKPLKYHQHASQNLCNITNMGSQIYGKSMSDRSCVFGAALGRQRGVQGNLFEWHLATICYQKGSQIYAKSMTNRSCVCGAARGYLRAVQDNTFGHDLASTFD